MARLGRVEAPGISTESYPGGSIVWSRALGANVVDADGNRYLDFTAGFGVAGLGHRPPSVVAAIGRQSERLLHALGDVSASDVRVELSERLARRVPIDDAVLYPAISGSDAVEIALKTARLATGRDGILAFDPSYHGLTLGSLAATSRAAFRRPFEARLAPHVVRVPFASPPARIRATLRDAVPAVGAVVVEPVVGREGVLLPPRGWLADVCEATREAGAVFVADEIFTGFGRTGTWFAVESEGVRPDLMVLGKALGGGLPIGCVAGRRELFEGWRTEGEPLHTATFLGHPLAAAAALAVLEQLERSRIIERASATLAPLLADGLRRIASRSTIRDVRGRGLLWALQTDRPATALAVAGRARARGLLLLAGGAGGDVLQIAPPLVTTPDQVRHGLDLLAQSFDDPPRAEPPR